MKGIIDQRLQGTVWVGLVVLMALGLSIQGEELQQQAHKLAGLVKELDCLS